MSSQEKHLNRAACTNRGFTRVELLVVIAAMILLAIVATLRSSRPVVTASDGDTLRSQQITCENNLKQLGTAYRIWANDNGDRYPFTVPVGGGGWSNLLSTVNAGPYCWTNFLLMAAEIGSSRVVACPDDTRQPAPGFGAFSNNTTLSYFVGVQASDSNPTSILSGDRNLGQGKRPDSKFGFSPEDGNGNDVIVNGPVSWSQKIHSKGNRDGAGYVLLGDGSVQSTTSAALNTNIVRPLLTNGGGFRLVFP